MKKIEANGLTNATRAAAYFQEKEIILEDIKRVQFPYSFRYENDNRRYYGARPRRRAAA